MEQTEVEAFAPGFDNVERTENFGYAFFFVGGDHRLPFMTVADSDNEYDNVSGLSREGVFRVNIGMSRETFASLVGGQGSETPDYAGLHRPRRLHAAPGLREAKLRLHLESDRRERRGYESFDLRGARHSEDALRAREENLTTNPSLAGCRAARRRAGL